MQLNQKYQIALLATVCLLFPTMNSALASGEREDELDEAWLRSFNYILYIAKSPRTGKLSSICLQEWSGATIIPPDPINKKFTQSLSNLKLTQSAGIGQDIETGKSSVTVCETIRFDAYGDISQPFKQQSAWAIHISVCRTDEEPSTIRYVAQKMIDPYDRVRDGDEIELAEIKAKPDKTKSCPTPEQKYEYIDGKGWIKDKSTGNK